MGRQEDRYHSDRVINTVRVRRTTGNVQQRKKENERYRDRQGVEEKEGNDVRSLE